MNPIDRFGLDHKIVITGTMGETDDSGGSLSSGPCTNGATARTVPGQVGAQPADRAERDVRVADPVPPENTLVVASGEGHALVSLEAGVGETIVLSAGKARFA